jgi:hypothetical protein
MQSSPDSHRADTRGDGRGDRARAEGSLRARRMSLSPSLASRPPIITSVRSVLFRFGISRVVFGPIGKGCSPRFPPSRPLHFRSLFGNILYVLHLRLDCRLGIDSDGTRRCGGTESSSEGVSRFGEGAYLGGWEKSANTGNLPQNKDIITPFKRHQSETWCFLNSNSS